MMTRVIYNDGGRRALGLKKPPRGKGDCVIRAIAIASGRPYAEVWDELYALQVALGWHPVLIKSPEELRHGVVPKLFKEYMKRQGWRWTPTMHIGSGCRVHLRADELPKGTIICRCSKHIVAVIDGVIQDTGNPTRGGTRCVYGYWSKP